jgi:hypothetical protein
VETMTLHRRSMRQLVRRHLRQREIISAAGGEMTGGGALPLGVPGITTGPGGEVAVDGERCAPAYRSLSDLLGTGAYLADRAAVAARHGQGYDPVLYHAFRDFLPPREKGSGRCVAAGTPAHDRAQSRDHLFADLVVYQPGILPGGEPFRSTGHWNLPGQLEIFQTLTGRVLMLVGGHTYDGRPFLYEQVCGPGEVMVVPFDIWHVTYVLDGPAVVFNLTTEVSGSPGRVDAHPGEEKYHRASPIAITARRDEERHDFVGSPDGWCTWGRPAGAPRTDWLRSFLAPGDSLADLHLYASPARLAALERMAQHAYRLSWPYDGGFTSPAGIQL